MRAYYNENDPYAAAWLRNLIAEGLIPNGIVDERSITDVQPADLVGVTQCHFFAGLGGWGAALRLAGLPDDRPIWTGSCPCQPFSVAGKGAGTADVRHLWPDFFRLIRACRPALVMGEQVAGAAGYGWLDGVVADLAAEGYASRGVDIPACAVDAPHIRSRLYWIAVADASHTQPQEREGDDCQQGQRQTQRRGQFVRTGAGTGSGIDVRVCSAGDGRSEAVAACRGDVARTLADASRGRRSGPSKGQGELKRRAELADGRSFGDVADTDLIGQPHERVNGLRRAAIHDVDGRGERVDVGHANDQGSPERPLATDGRETLRHERPSACQTGAGAARNGTHWSDHVWLVGADGKARRSQPGICLLAHGVPARVGKLRALGNAIVPQVAAEIIAAFMVAS